MNNKIPILRVEGIKVISVSEGSDEYLRYIGKEVLRTLHKQLMHSPEEISEDGVVSNTAKSIVQTYLEV